MPRLLAGGPAGMMASCPCMAEGSPSTTDRARGQPVAGLRERLLAIEETWLGFASEPLAMRLERARWQPDDPDLVCPRCAASVGRYEALEGSCNACRDSKLAVQRTLRLGPYAGVLGEIVREIKFQRFRTLGVQVGRMLGERLASELASASIAPGRAVLVPIPMSWRRRVSRGIDHTQTLCRGVSATSGCPITPLLSRRHGPTQLAVTASKRAANVRKSFRVCRSPKNSVECLILVDDVRTTGATLNAAGRTLLRHLHLRRGVRGNGPMLWSLVVASADTGRGAL